LRPVCTARYDKAGVQFLDRPGRREAVSLIANTVLVDTVLINTILVDTVLVDTVLVGTVLVELIIVDHAYLVRATLRVTVTILPP